MFGPGRYARTAYRVRESTPPDLRLSFVARVGPLLVGANAMTPIFIGETPAYLLGPLIVEPVFRSRGIGEALVNASLEAARATGGRLAILVGDEPYYARMGFKAHAAGAGDPAGAGRSVAGAGVRTHSGGVRRRAGQNARRLRRQGQVARSRFQALRRRNLSRRRSGGGGGASPASGVTRAEASAGSASGAGATGAAGAAGAAGASPRRGS